LTFLQLLHERWFNLFLMALALIGLSGCQSVSSNSKTSSGSGALSANPASLGFGDVQAGKSSTLSDTLTNTGASPVTISQASVSSASFTITGLSLPTTLNPSQSVTFSAMFSPSAAGSASGTVSIASDASNSPLSIALSGTGTAQGQLSVSPATLNFGNVVVGANSSLNGSLTASGAPVTVSSGSSNSSEFALSGISLPVTIQAGQSAPFTVTFTPNASGTANASLSFASNASSSPTAESLTGTGTAALQHSVGLSWNASTGAVTYNIYRKLLTDTNYNKIGSGDTSTTYTDNSVASGMTYDYVVTAVDANNVESGYSNVAQAIIPTP
jgi:uncharacterized protein YceK